MAKVTDEKAYSIFDTRTTAEEIHQEIQQVYLADSRPWVVGYSGGKDSQQPHFTNGMVCARRTSPRATPKAGLRYYV